MPFEEHVHCAESIVKSEPADTNWDDTFGVCLHDACLRVWFEGMCFTRCSREAHLLAAVQLDCERVEQVALHKHQV